MPHPVDGPKDDTAPQALVRIQRLSKPFSILFTALAAIMFFLSFVMVVAPLFYDGPHIRVSNDLLETGRGVLHFMPDLSRDAAQTTMPLSDLPLGIRLISVVNLALLQWGSLALIFYHCQKLFRLYEQGDVFAPENVTCIRNIALWIAAWSAAPIVGHYIAILSGAFTVDQSWLRAISFGGMVFAGFLLVLAKVIDLGREIETDRARYI